MICCSSCYQVYFLGILCIFIFEQKSVSQSLDIGHMETGPLETTCIYFYNSRQCMLNKIGIKWTPES